MSRQRYEADDPREWVSRAKSNLRLASLHDPEVHLEELCFNAQQAAEKAIKGVFVKLGKEFPYTHNLAKLIHLLEEAHVEVPEGVRSTEELTRFALEARYPSIGREIGEEEYQRFVRLAKSAVAWAEKIIGSDAVPPSSKA